MKLTLKHAIVAIMLLFSFTAPVAAGNLEDYFAGDAADHSSTSPNFKN